jgi:hypothetical protein
VAPILTVVLGAIILIGHLLMYGRALHAIHLALLHEFQTLRQHLDIILLHLSHFILTNMNLCSWILIVANHHIGLLVDELLNLYLSLLLVDFYGVLDVFEFTSVSVVLV